MATTSANPQQINNFFKELASHRVGNMIEFYNQYGGGYDVALGSEGYDGITEYCPKVLSELVQTEMNLKPEDAEVIDIGCGSGKSGYGLLKYGFKKIDGADGSSTMLKICSDRKIFRNLYEALITDSENLSMIPDETYDAMVCVGCIAKNHIAIRNAIPEFMRVIKVGGIGCYTVAPSADKIEAMNELTKHLELKNVEIVRIENKFYADTRENNGNDCHVVVLKKLKKF